MGQYYRERIIDEAIKNYLEVFGGVLIEGAKLIGKSTTCSQHANTIIKFQDAEKKDYYKSAVSTNPTALLEGDKPILFDEWQDNYSIWDTLRHSIDETGKSGLYLLTGSSNINKDKVMHTGTGRIVRLKMYPMSLYESGDSNGKISLEDLFDGKTNVLAQCNLTIDKIIDLIIRGGFPATIDKGMKQAKLLMSGYYTTLINEKIQAIDGVKRDPKKMNSLLKSYARNISTYVNDVTMKQDMENEGFSVSDVTFRDYKNTLEKLYIIENIESWPTSIRSKTAIRKSEKKALVDTSLACAALRLSKEKIMKDFNYFGFLFEAFCLRDLRIYVESIDGNIYSYRDETGYEVDAVLELNDGRWGAVEVKLSADAINNAAKNLLKLEKKIDTGRKGNPEFLMVLYGGKNSYLRDDGVLVVSIGNLKN